MKEKIESGEFIAHAPITVEHAMSKDEKIRLMYPESLLKKFLKMLMDKLPEDVRIDYQSASNDFYNSGTYDIRIIWQDRMIEIFEIRCMELNDGSLYVYRIGVCTMDIKQLMSSYKEDKISQFTKYAYFTKSDIEMNMRILETFTKYLALYLIKGKYYLSQFISEQDFKLKISEAEILERACTDND